MVRRGSVWCATARRGAPCGAPFRARIRLPGASMLGEVGFPQTVVNTVYEDVKVLLPDHSEPTWKPQNPFFLLLKYLHHMPTKERFRSVMHSGIGGSIFYSTFYRHCIPIAEIVAANVNYIHWHRHLSPTNHHRLMPFFVTPIVDGFPVPVPGGQALQASAQPREVQVHMPEGRAHHLA